MFQSVLCATLAIVCVLPGGFSSGIFYRADAPILTQYHSQGELGEYSYGYNAGLSGKVETRSTDGVTRGSYSYLDSNGILQTVEYTADATNGFRAAATNLPKAPMNNAIAPEPVKDTPEVIKARAEHMAALNREAARTPIADDTVETMAAPIPAPVAQISRIETIDNGFVAVRAAEFPRNSFSYQFSSPLYAYTTAYANAPYIAFSAPALRALPIPIQSAAVEIRAAAAPLELRAPTETPEVAMARAEHLAAVEKQKARIAAGI